MTARPIHRFGTAAARLHGLPAQSAGGLAFYGLAHDPSSAQLIRDASQLGPAFPIGADWGDAAHNDPASLGPAFIAAGALPTQAGGTLADATAFAARVLSTTRAWLILVAPGLVHPPAHARGLLAVGTHDLVPVTLHDAWTKAGGSIVPAAALLPATAGAIAAAVILDLDVIDTGHAAGACGLNVGGLSPAELFDAIDTIRTRFTPVAIALCNMAPARDPRGHTERIAAEALYRLVAA